MLAELLINGTVGSMRIGQPKTELLDVLGPPPMWHGKPGTILDRGISDYERSRSWIYNGVYVSFENEAISEFNLWMMYPIDFGHAWFLDWNLPQRPTLNQMMEYLNACKIPYAPNPADKYFRTLVLFGAIIEYQITRYTGLEEITLYGVSRFKDSRHVPILLGPSFDIQSLEPKSSQL